MQIQRVLPEVAKNIISVVRKFDSLLRFFICKCDISLQTFYPFIAVTRKNA